MSKQKIEYITLRKVGGSIYLKVPIEYVHLHQLVPGDIAVWWPGEKIRIVKQAQLAELANQAEELKAAT
jgi:hypothetical protein